MSAVSMSAEDAPALPRALLPALVSGALLAAALLLGRAAAPWFNLPVEALRIDGQLNHVQPAQVAATAGIAPGTLLFEVDLEAVRSHVEALPWVARARVARVWPRRIAVRVWEREPVARWGDDGLVDTQGQTYTPPAKDLAEGAADGLPRLAGPPGRAAEVLAAYRGLGKALAGSDFTPAGLKLDARGAWTLVTTAGLELRLGEDDPVDKAGLILGAVSRTLAGKLGEVAYIDLRYTNGFAVGPASNGIAVGPAAPAPAPQEPKHE
jgi:cell division protein FtsQ